MDNNVMVTVGIPVFNAENFLKYAIQSVLLQTYGNLEILITIDGATDDSVSIVNGFRDPRIKLIIENEKKGIAVRLNEQIRMARGLFFARMDADDIMFPGRIAQQLEYMTGHPEVDVIGGQAVVINNSNIVIGFREWDPVLSSRSLLRKALFIHPTVFGKTSWFLNNPYSPDFEGVEDYYLWNESFSRSGFYVMEEPMIFYRDPPGNDIGIYLTRQKQLRKALKALVSKSSINSIYYRKLLLMSKMKSILYLVLDKLDLSNILILSRNSRIPPDKLSVFEEMLREIVNKCTLQD